MLFSKVKYLSNLAARAIGTIPSKITVLWEKWDDINVHVTCFKYNGNEYKMFRKDGAILAVSLVG